MTTFRTLAELSGKRVHFIGIGGAGMSGIARILLARGVEVSGSDIKSSSVTDNLQNLGTSIFIGHAAENINGADLIVLSTAISDQNPEKYAAVTQGVPMIARAQALAILMHGMKSVAVAGTHGKTTTTSMLTVALQGAGADPSFAIGGMINSSGINAYSGSGDIFVAEADESDGSFVHYKPLGAIITNIELDHVDHFATLDAVYEIFKEFIDTIESGGFLIACGDDPGVRTLLPRVSREDISIVTYGVGENDWNLSHIHLSESSSIGRVTHNGKVVGELSLRVPGEHNLLNALAGLAASFELGIPSQMVLEGLNNFTGSRRRFELKGEVRGIKVVDDYGHHPTEIRVTLETARRFAQGGKVIVIFQPHRYSRTKAFAQEFATALNLADEVFILEVYAASEDPIPGVSSMLITASMEPEKAHYQPSMIEVVEEVTRIVRPGDLIMTLGAGDVSSLAPVIVQALERV